MLHTTDAAMLLAEVARDVFQGASQVPWRAAVATLAVMSLLAGLLLPTSGSLRLRTRNQ